MENHQQPFNGGFALYDQYNPNINGLPLVSGQNSHGIRGAEHDPDDSRFPLVDAEIPENEQPHYDPNADDVAPNSPPIAAENFHADSSADMANIIDQIMGRAPPPVFSFSDSSGFQADAYMTAVTPPLFVPPEPNTTFMDNMPPQNGNFHALMDNQTQTAPLYDAATANGMNNSGLSASFSSNYFFPVNDMMQQPSMYASNPQPNWQGNALGNQYGQYSAPPAMFNPQPYNSFPQVPSTSLVRPQQPSPGNQFMNVTPFTPGTSLPVMSQFSPPNMNSVMSDTSLPVMSHFNSLNTSPRMPETSMQGSVAYNPMNASPMMPETYSLPVSASNAMPVASYGNPGRRVTFVPGMSARIEPGYNTFTSSALQSSPSGSSSSGASTGGNSYDINNQISGTSSARAGTEILRQDGSGTHASVASSQQGSSSRLETYQQMISDEPIFNRVYDPRYAELGLPVDPYLRMFNQHPEFWKKVQGNVDLSKK